MMTHTDRPQGPPASVPHRRIHFAWLFASIVLYILLSPWFDSIGSLASVGLSLVLIAAAYSTVESGNVWAPGALAVAALGMTWLQVILSFTGMAFVSYGLYLGVFLFAAARVFQFVIRSPRVNLNVLMAGVSVYLLLGLAWGMFYLVVWQVDPGAFAGAVSADATAGVRAREMLYYSFVSLTTVGYGDITSVAPLARALSILEVLSGVLYLGVLVARLVSMYRSEAAAKP